MSCPAVIDVFVSTGPAAVDVVTPGPPGPPGSQWITGIGVPSPSVGTVGDLYLRQNGDVYGPKTSGGWGSVQFTLTGAGGASLSDDTPQPLGTASAGTSFSASRSDHRHAMPSAAQVGADPTGTAAAAIASHLAAADPHSQYTTPQEAAAAAPVQSVALSLPSGWSTQTTSTGGNVTLSLGLPTGQTLLATTDKTAWDAAAVLAGTAVQPAALATSLASKADLAGGVVPTSQIPAIALVQYLGSVAGQAAMLALRGQGGDWCIRTDFATKWVIVANDGASLADWIQLPTGIAPVSSINGQTGAVTLGTGDLTESGGNLFFTAARAIGAALAGFTAEAGTVAATDSILVAIQKMAGNIASRALSGAIGSSGLTMATARILGRSTPGTGPPEEFALLGLAFNGTNLATLADLVIPLSDETTPLTASSTVAKVTIPYWPRATTLTDPWIWAVAAAPTGAALQFDIQINGSSIYLPASGGTYPTIAASFTNSTSSTGTFTTAFAAAPTIPVGSSVSFFVRQIGSTIAGAGLKVIAQTRRAG